MEQQVYLIILIAVIFIVGFIQGYHHFQKELYNSNKEDAAKQWKKEYEEAEMRKAMDEDLAKSFYQWARNNLDKRSGDSVYIKLESGVHVFTLNQALKYFIKNVYNQ